MRCDREGEAVHGTGEPETRKQLRMRTIKFTSFLFLLLSFTQLGCGKSEPGKTAPAYKLSQTPEGNEMMSTPDGKMILVAPNSIDAVLAGAEVKNGSVTFWGRAADIKSAEFPGAILMFVNGKFAYLGNTGEDRPWLVEKFENPGLLKAGFRFIFPLEKFEKLESSEVRFISLWKNGVAYELSYPEEYRWAGKGESASRPQNVSPKDPSAYLLSSVPGVGKLIRAPDGRSFPVLTESMQANLGRAGSQGNVVRFSGWAADVKTGQLPQSIVMFKNGELFYVGKFGSLKPSLLEKYDYVYLLEAGFEYEFPAKALFGKRENVEVRMFAVWKNGIAMELHYFQGYPWGKRA
jgi:hypothetical protein